MARQRLVGEPFPDLDVVRRPRWARCSSRSSRTRCGRSRAARRTVPPAPPSRPRSPTAASSRHHVLRPTWHVVRVEDLGWMLDLTADRVIAQSRPQLRSTGLLDDRDRLVGLVGEIVEAADAPLTRREIGDALAARGIELAGQALGHVTMSAELDQVVTTGPRRGSWDTFVPYASRIPAGGDRPRRGARAARVDVPRRARPRHGARLRVVGRDHRSPTPGARSSWPRSRRSAPPPPTTRPSS